MRISVPRKHKPRLHVCTCIDCICATHCLRAAFERHLVKRVCHYFVHDHQFATLGEMNSAGTPRLSRLNSRLLNRSVNRTLFALNGAENANHFCRRVVSSIHHRRSVTRNHVRSVPQPSPIRPFIC